METETGKMEPLTVIINQKGKDLICICCDWSKKSTVSKVIQTLKDFGVLDYTVVVK